MLNFVNRGHWGTMIENELSLPCFGVLPLISQLVQFRFLLLFLQHHATWKIWHITRGSFPQHPLNQHCGRVAEHFSLTDLSQFIQLSYFVAVSLVGYFPMTDFSRDLLRQFCSKGLPRGQFPMSYMNNVRP